MGENRGRTHSPKRTRRSPSSQDANLALRLESGRFSILFVNSLTVTVLWEHARRAHRCRSRDKTMIRILHPQFRNYLCAQNTVYPSTSLGDDLSRSRSSSIPTRGESRKKSTKLNWDFFKRPYSSIERTTTTSSPCWVTTCGPWASA